MSCNNCNQIEEYNLCNPSPCVETQSCDCPTLLQTKCVTYEGDDLECSGIKSGTILTELIQQLDAFICEKVNDITNALTLKNVGLGAEVYKGIDLLGRKEIRSLITTGDILTSVQNENDITFGIDEEVLTNFVEDLIPEVCITSEDLSVSVTKDEVTGCFDLSMNLPQEICLTSEDDTIDIVEVEGCFDLSVNLPNNINVGTGENVYKGFNDISNLQEFKTLNSVQGTINFTPSTDELSLDVVNLQKTINTFPYTLLDTDDKNTLFINNGAVNVVINVPDSLVDNFSCALIQKGTGTIDIVATGTATVNEPSGLDPQIKGQYHWALIEKELTTDVYYLGGSLKAI